MTRSILGWLFSKWFFLAFFALGLAYLITLPMMVDNVAWRTAGFQTFGLMTGSDPFTFRDVIESHVVAWSLAWLIHLASWLLIPALIALIVADARDDIKRTQSLDEGFAALAAEAGFSKEEIPGIVELLNAETERYVAEVRKGD